MPSAPSSPKKSQKLTINDYDMMFVHKIAIQLIYEKSDSKIYHAELVKLLIHAETEKTIAVVIPTDLSSYSKEELVRTVVTLSHKLFGHADIMDTVLVLDSDEMDLVEQLSITEVMKDEEDNFTAEDSETTDNKVTLH